MGSRGAGHDAADGAGAVPAGDSKGVATSDKQSKASIGDVPKALDEMHQE